jgi:hypothetical protein
MLPKFSSILTLFSAFAVISFGQGLQTNASKDDWEEINFEYNSAILSDGYPSLLRLADLLQANPAYKVRIEGHADHIGSEQYNQKLGLARANTVRDFLVKYGARADQITTSTRGEDDPKVQGERRRYSRTDVARWMNRRVVLTVTDENGRTVSAGGVREAIAAMPPQMQQCCDEILKRLDRLDEIAKMLKDMAEQNAALRKEVDNLKQQQAALDQRVSGLPKPLNEEQTAAVVQERLEKNREPRFALLGLNLGADSWQHVTFTGRARYFAPFKEHFALQAQGEYMYFHEAREGQFDIGLVSRLGRFQGGLFSSFKHVTLRGNQNSGTLGQASLTLDYLFNRGKVGVFGTHGFLNSSVINRQNATMTNGVIGQSCAGAAPGACITLPNVFLERYLSVVDQTGLSGTVGLVGNTYLEGNIGYLRSRANADRPGGTLRFVFPISNRLAFTVEGGMNETLVERDNWGRAVVGIQFGNFTRPKEFATVDHPVPADVPRVRYEVLTRTVRNGAAPPVADAGPDQIGVAAGAITLDGSKSYDPNGEKLTYSWTQEAGPSVALSGANSATASFTAAAGEVYVFRLTVRNESGLSASARTRITTRAEERVQILLFAANPQQIQSGQSSQLSWRVLNATEVTISEIGKVAESGTSTVSPTQTTTYKLTARNGNSEENATATVVVQQAQTRIFGCFVTPTNITAGEAATINFQTENATSVSVTPNVGPVGTSGSFVVNPTETTTYTLTASGPNNATSTCSVTVTVQPPNTGLPRVIRFTAAPRTITAGQTASLVWQVENADSVSISPAVGNVQLVGTQDVQPQQTTTYTLTATNANGNTTATATVTVTPATGVQITTFTANPPVSPSPGSPVTLTCLATGATTVAISGAGALSPQGTVVVNPTTDTTYTCTATGANGAQASKTLTVTVTSGPPPSGPPPVVVISGGPVIETAVRTVQLDASQSTSPAGFTPLTYYWTSRDGRSGIANATSPTPVVYLGNMIGDYFFDVTVRDARGNTATGSVTVRLTVTRVP